LRFCIALWKCAASSMPTFAHGDSLSPIAWHPHCLFLRANRPAIASQISSLCYPLPLGKRNPTPFSRDVQLSTIAVYIMLLYSAAQHQRVTQARQRKAWQAAGIVETGNGYGYRKTRQGTRHTTHHARQAAPHTLPAARRERQAGSQPPHATRGRGWGTWHGAAG
jgi:hypothetical protein